MKKSMDIVKPFCQNRHQHYQLRKWVDSLPSLGWEDDGYFYLIVRPNDHPCTWHITREDLLGEYSAERFFRNLGKLFLALGKP